MKSEEIKKEILQLDTLLDTELCECEYDRIENEIRELYIKLAEEEKKERLLSYYEPELSEWEKEFLNSFQSNKTRIITLRQFGIFKRIAKGKLCFRVGNVIYDFDSYKQFACLNVTKF